ncbi:MAG TPA: hypothetical protein VFK05_30605 [Polyangiaceae bacterium]|nr:hypothetical protein [Polyangiaceae bacterium]
MFTCERCGAGLPPNGDQCGYCGTVSPAARAALAAEAARQAHHRAALDAQVAVLKVKLQSSTEQAASRTLMWGLLSFVVFCLPIFNLLALLAFKRAQTSAREAGTPLPTRATVGLLCAALTGALCVGFWIWVVIDMRANDARVEARKAELSKQIAAHPEGPTLDQPFACALAELYVLSNGYDGSTNTGLFRDVDCAGAVTVLNGRAEMPDFKFRVSSTEPQRSATICYKLGARWFVQDVRATGCELK